MPNKTLKDILDLLYDYNHDHGWEYNLVITDLGQVTIEDEFNCKPLGIANNLTLCYDSLAFYVKEMKK